MQSHLEERAIRLTEEEAMGLLELAMACPMELSPEQRAAVVKLGEFCRQFMRVDAANRAITDNKNLLLPPACAA
jgi:hypothetical protein